MIKEIFLGRCPTCNEAVYAVVRDGQFVGDDGDELPYIAIEGHCGVPGHSALRGTITPAQFEEAE